MATKPEFLVAKEKMLVALVTILVAILSSAKAAFIMYTAGGRGGGAQRIFFKWAKCFKISPISYRVFSQPPFHKKEWASPPPPPSLDKERRGYKGTRTLLF